MKTAERAERIRYFDLLRCISFIFIIFYHMVIQLWLDGIYPIESISRLYENANMHIATLGVAMFFILSGACQVCSISQKMDLWLFYKKKIFRILIPFYITYIGYLIFRCLFLRSQIFPEGVPKWRILFTVLGMDEWLNMHGIRTYSLGIGEWFLGCILILYALFPLLYYLMKKNAPVFFAAATVIYLIVIFNYNFSVAVYTNLLVKGYEFICGMMIGEKFRDKTFPKWLAVITVPFTVICFIGRPVLQWNQGLQITVTAVALWISISYLEPVLRKFRLKIMDMVSGYSYEVFLVHHVIIYVLTVLSVPYLRGRTGVVLLFLVQLFCMAVAAWILKRLTRKTEQMIHSIADKIHQNTMSKS